MKKRLVVIPVNIQTLGVAVPFNFNMPSGYDRITGIAITADANATLGELYETTLAEALKIGEKDVFPQNLGARSLYTGNEACPNERFWRLDECVSVGTTVTGSLVNTVSVAGQYTLKVLIQLEKNEPKAENRPAQA